MNYGLPFPEEVLLAEEDQNAEEKSPLDGAWYKRKQNNPGKNYVAYYKPDCHAEDVISNLHS